MMQQTCHRVTANERFMSAIDSALIITRSRL